jgi:hypothetical protein
MQFEDKNGRQAAKLRRAGWLEAEELAEAGYRNPEFLPEDDQAWGIECAITAFRDDRIEKLYPLLEFPEPGGREGGPIDGKIQDLLDFQLTRQMSSGHFVSPEALRFMQQEGFLVKGLAAEKQSAAPPIPPGAEAFKRGKPERKGISPSSPDITDRKGRGRE